MPTNAVKTARDEHLWEQAKKIAEKQGRSKDYAYIMGIFQRSKGEKSMAALLAGGEDELRKAQRTAPPKPGGALPKDPGEAQCGTVEKARKAPAGQMGFDFGGGGSKGGPYIGPRGGKYADPDHKIPWKEEGARESKMGGAHRDFQRAHRETAQSIRDGKKDMSSELQKYADKVIGYHEQAAAAHEKAATAHDKGLNSALFHSQDAKNYSGQARAGTASLARKANAEAKSRKSRKARNREGSPSVKVNGKESRPGMSANAHDLLADEHERIAKQHGGWQSPKGRAHDAAADGHVHARNAMLLKHPESHRAAARSFKNAGKAFYAAGDKGLGDHYHEQAAYHERAATTEKSMSLMDEFDKLEKAAKGTVIGRTADGKEVYAAGIEAEEHGVDDPGTPEDESKKGPQPPPKPGQQAAPPQPGQEPAPEEDEEEEGGAGAIPPGAASQKGGAPPAGPPQAQEGPQDAAGDAEGDTGEGSHGHHAKQALAHLQAAQAHASAAHSAKKVAEAKEHGQVVQNAKEMSAQAANGMGQPMEQNGQQPPPQKGEKQVPQDIKKSFRKNNLHIDLSAEDQVLALLDQQGTAIGAQQCSHPYDGRHHLLGMRGERLDKATIYQGEYEGPRGGDMRESVARAQGMAEMIEIDDAGNMGNGGLDEWYRDAWGRLSTEEKSQARQGMAGPLATGWQKGMGGDESVTIIDDDNVYNRAIIKGGQHGEHQSAIRLAYQGEGREDPK